MSTGTEAIRDTQRAKVYAAESFVRTLFDRVAEHGSPVVEFCGTQLTLPPEARFGSVVEVQRYLDQVLALPSVRRKWPVAAPLTVRARRGATAAHYEYRSGAGIIALPERRTADWAMRELVVLHELAHHLCGQGSRPQPPHGSEFVATMCTVAELVMGAELGHVLRVVYAQNCVR